MYVIALDPRAAHRRHDLARMRAGAPAFYVGQTALPPEARLQEHLSGSRYASTIVTRFGRAIVYVSSLYRDRDAAERAERTAAAALKRAGAVVLGRH